VETIVAIHRNHFGEIISFVTSSGRIISYQKAVMEIENGMIHGVMAVADNSGLTKLIPEENETFDTFPNLF
jgi:hypothetical protein